MLEQIRKFLVTALTVQGFKGHKDPVTYQFGDLNEITGHMGVGKSSIADAIAFAITGVTFFGSSKLDSLFSSCLTKRVARIKQLVKLSVGGFKQTIAVVLTTRNYCDSIIA